jgi:thiosulfate/3-mercaptopyruvate sulfurtransferase
MVSYGMAFTTLISTGTLALHLDDPAYAVIDCRFRLDDVEWGEREYVKAHIPGAVYAHLDRDLSGAKTGANGRHPLPAPGALASALAGFGIESGVQAIAYDQDNGMYASRLWWLLRWLGHDAVAVLDGGFAKWTSEGRPTTNGVEGRPTREFKGLERPGMMVNASDVASLAGKPEWRLVDARAPERYRGDKEPIDKVPGHIPGAANYFFGRNLDASGTFRSPEEIRQQLDSQLGPLGHTAPDHIVCYCGSGVTACHNLLAFEHAGITGAKLYPGSWSEWSSDEKRPVETGG